MSYFTMVSGWVGRMVKWFGAHKMPYVLPPFAPNVFPLQYALFRPLVILELLTLLGVRVLLQWRTRAAPLPQSLLRLGTLPTHPFSLSPLGRPSCRTECFWKRSPAALAPYPSCPFVLQRCLPIYQPPPPPHRNGPLRTREGSGGRQGAENLSLREEGAPSFFSLVAGSCSQRNALTPRSRSGCQRTGG